MVYPLSGPLAIANHMAELSGRLPLQCSQNIGLTKPHFCNMNNTLHRQRCPHSVLSKAASVPFDDFLREKWDATDLEYFKEKDDVREVIFGQWNLKMLTKQKSYLIQSLDQAY